MAKYRKSYSKRPSARPTARRSYRASGVRSTGRRASASRGRIQTVRIVVQQERAGAAPTFMPGVPGTVGISNNPAPPKKSNF